MGLNQQNIDLSDSDKVAWLADQICTSFPKEVTALKLYVMDCGCINYQRVFRNGDLGPQMGIYRDAEDGLCDVCMGMSEDWKDRVVDETLVYNSKFQVEL